MVAVDCGRHSAVDCGCVGRHSAVEGPSLWVTWPFCSCCETSVQCR